MRFGRLTVIKRVENYEDGRTAWLCLCDCGNTKKVSTNNLKRGNVKSCGCLRRETSKANEKNAIKSLRPEYVDGTCIKSIRPGRMLSTNTSGVTGVSYTKKINKWHAYIQIQGITKRLGYFKNFEDAVKARKDAEEKYYKPILEKKKSGSPNERQHFKDHIGERFGTLVVLDYYSDNDNGKNHNEYYYRCRCDCGNVKDIRCAAVLSGRTMSCGCARSDNRREVGREQFTKMNETNIADGTNLNIITRDKPMRTNKSGVTGVCWDKSHNRWKAQITLRKQTINLGRFDKFDDAVAARKAAEDLYFKPIIEKYKK